MAKLGFKSNLSDSKTCVLHPHHPRRRQELGWPLPCLQRRQVAEDGIGVGTGDFNTSEIASAAGSQA